MRGSDNSYSVLRLSVIFWYCETCFRFSCIVFRMKPSVAELCTSCIKNICGGVDTGLAGILNNTDDEADTNNLHCDIIRNTKQAAGKRNQKQ